ncbi:rfaE bifunctional protein nucleotidyltransferase chain/domain [Mucilaginibacter gracilis]|uniref:D-glycero-beta-D-manno-heptose 1-phosphate adenylyltransferase n=1 Tax=Mucilaginibacter gracilis TaxID=423350 RepID=A0A495IW02_9SPHI|nr:D-glycero-beta-D-manno-heptose 1-phosphate adenylyltransferase [Mucilaginibacter gracilis]RKR80039.1 rfaE bifunctional protein nucleotidyltransferase chain/domain [Mucilaginibacter gracilis]
METITEKQVKEKIYSLEDASAQVKKWQADGDKVVFTNGCFDLLHLGHITYLAEAASLGNKLVVAINSDASVKRLKGSNRPINNEVSRGIMLACFFFIDAIVVFDEDTPLETINSIMPDILVKGGDYTIPEIVGAVEVMANGGTVEVLQFVPGYSSTNIINRIRNGAEAG